MANDRSSYGAKLRRSNAAKRKLAAQHGNCFFCETKLSRWTVTVDHFIPTHRGGANTWRNKVLACEPCNKKKAHTIPLPLVLFKFRAMFGHWPELKNREPMLNGSHLIGLYTREEIDQVNDMVVTWMKSGSKIETIRLFNR